MELNSQGCETTVLGGRPSRAGHVCVEQRRPPLEQRLLWKRNELPLQKVFQLWEGLALVLRVSEVQLTIQGTRSTHPHQRTYPGRGSHSPGWVSLGTVWGEGWG